MNQSALREEMCRVGQSLFARGYVHATAGNISVRLSPEQGGGFLITPTDACLGALDPARLAHVDQEGRQVSGDRASKTLVLHQAIYSASAATGAPAGCVIHTHSTHCVAMTLAPAHWRPITGQGIELLPPITPYFVMKVGHVPLIDYARPGHPVVGERVAQAIATYAGAGTPLRAVMLDRLGPNVWHESPAQAMAVLEELEETARLWHLSRGQAPTLDAVALGELRETFGAAW
jgi:ribulose-5-phosphate 4-epimerase/fuculose-1-phosphate aldolase